MWQYCKVQLCVFLGHVSVKAVHAVVGSYNTPPSFLCVGVAS